MSRNSAYLASIVFLAFTQILATGAFAQNAQVELGYPNRAIRMVLPFPPGGATDVIARKIGLKFTEKWGQQVIIDNRPGAGGNIAAEIVAKATPDGYTLFFAASAQLAVNPSLYARVPFDPVKSFAPVVLVGSVPNILVANPSLPVHTLKELIAFAKARPGELNYASPGSGSTAHLSAELLKMDTGIDIMHIPYKGAATGVIDVVSGQVPLMFVSMPSVLGYVRTGKLRGLGITGSKRSQAASEIPTFSETIPNFESSAWYGMLGPAGTPPAIIEKLNRGVLNILKMSDVRKFFASQAIEIIGTSPSGFANYIKSELAKWAVVVKKSGARVD